MPRPSLTIAMSQAMFSRTTAEEVVILLMLSHASWATPLRRALRRTSIVSRGETYFPLHFAPAFPGQSEEGFKRWSVEIDGVDQTILRDLRAVSTRPEAVVEVILASDPNTVQMTTGDGYQVYAYPWNRSTITLDIGLHHLQSEGYPGGRILPSNFPGGF